MIERMVRYVLLIFAIFALDMKGHLNIGLGILLLKLFSANLAYGQIEISGEEPKKEKAKKEKEHAYPEDEEPTLTTTAYAFFNYAQTFRTLVPNEGLFGDTLGFRANETPLNTFSYGIGFRAELLKMLDFDGGLAYMQNGESYTETIEDTTYSYTSKYTYIGLPLKLMFKAGKKYRFIAAAGVVPQIFMRFRMYEEWMTGSEVRDSEITKRSSGFNSFAISTLFNAGFECNFGDRYGVIILPEYRMQLNSSFEKNDSFIHKARALGVNIGFSMKL